MKQCPNTNCIFYTRLEELPDAYVKCPGCGGMLVDSDTLSGKLAPDPKSRPPASSYPLPVSTDLDTDPHLERVDPDVFAPREEDPYAGDPYAYEQPPEEDPQATGGQQASWSTASKTIVALSALLLVGACAIVVLLLGNRLFPQGKTITSVQATQTALASRPVVVNTPIIVPPTTTLSAVVFPSPTGIVIPPTAVVNRPTQVVPSPTAVVLPPTEVVLPPTTQPVPTLPGLPSPTPLVQEATPGPTAPPPRTQPSGGIANAQMSTTLQGGAPAGNVSAYNPSDPFNLAVQASFGAGAVTSVTTRWYGPDGRQIYEMRKPYSQPGTYYTGFTLRKSTPWSIGDYRVDIYTNDAASPAYSVTFSVVP
jgi:hypothetical protein